MKKVLVAMSGGVDFSVTAYLGKRRDTTVSKSQNLRR